MIQSPETLLGLLMTKARDRDHLINLAAMAGAPPTDTPVGAPPVAQAQTGGVGNALSPQAVQPNPAMKVPPIPGINTPNAGNPSIGAALVGGR